VVSALVQALSQRPPEQSPLAAALSVAVVPWYVVLLKGGWVGGWCEICSVSYLSMSYTLILILRGVIENASLFRPHLADSSAMSSAIRPQLGIAPTAAGGTQRRRPAHRIGRP